MAMASSPSLEDTFPTLALASTSCAAMPPCCHMGSFTVDQEAEILTPDSQSCSHGDPLMLSAKEESFQAFINREFAHHEPGAARINNGSFGSCPASVQAAQGEWANLFLRQPDRFYFGPLDEGLLAARRAVASVIHSPHVDQVILLDNVTVAVATVLQRIAWDFLEGRYQKGDAILSLNYCYGAVKKALKAYLLRAGAQLIEVQLPFPVSSNDEILSSFNAALKQAERESQRIRFAVIDHITSMPTILLPVRELVRLCRRAGIDQVLVDGAHAIGGMDIDVQAIDADYYTSNLHKWLFAPPSVAFMHCKSERLSYLHHPIVSHNYENGLGNECAWIGTRDYSAQLAAANAIDFFGNFEGGIRAVQSWNHWKVVSMGMMLAKAWGTHCGTPPALCSTMIMVGLPSELRISSSDDALNLRTRLRQDFGIEVPVYHALDTPSIISKPLESGARSPDVTAYVRISHQIYNRLDDYMRLRDAVNLLITNASVCRLC